MVLDKNLILEELGIGDGRIIGYVENSMTHTDAGTFLKRIGKSIDDYKQMHLSVARENKGQSLDAELYKAEIALADKAVYEGCFYVTDMDYQLTKEITIIIATGLIPKKL